jgi:hypothetical protein
MTQLRHSMAALRDRRVSIPRTARAPELREVDAVTKDGRPCTVRYHAGGDVISVWVPRFEREGGSIPSESLDRLALVAREWLSWAREEAARDEAYRGRS